MPRSSIESKDRHARRGTRGAQSRVDASTHTQGQMISGAPAQPSSHPNAQTASKGGGGGGAGAAGGGGGGGAGGGGGVSVSKGPSSPTGFKFIIQKPSAIVIDLLGVLVCKSFMSSSREFRDYFQHNVLEYLTDNWKQKQLKIMINFFRCSQQNVPDEYKLADRDETKEDQIKQAKKHVIWKLRNDPTNSALSLFMLGITEWGYKNKTLMTPVYDEVPLILKQWKEHNKIPVYVGVGSADFLIMVLSNTVFGNLLPYFNGHMNIMDFDGTRANKDYRKLANLLRLAPEKILYLTRFRQDCKRAMECGMQSLIVLRQDFDSHGLVGQLRIKRGTMTSIDGSKLARGAYLDDPSPPPRIQPQPEKNPDLKKQYETNISSLSLIDDHESNDRYNIQSSTIGEQDLTKYSIVLSLSEIIFK